MVEPTAEPAPEEKPEVDGQALANTLINPFGPRGAELREGNPEKSEALPNPFRNTPKTQDQIKFEQVATMLPAVNRVLSTTEELIDSNRYRAERALSGATLRRYGMELDNVEGVVKGVGKYLGVAEYAVIARNILETDGTERERHVAEFVTNATKDLTETGFDKFGVRLLGERVMQVTKTLNVWLAVPSILLSPEQTQREPAEIIRDDRTSLREKQDAAGRLWRQYERFGHMWQEAQKVELAELSGIVYRRATAEENQRRMELR